MKFAKPVVCKIYVHQLIKAAPILHDERISRKNFSVIP